MRALALFLLAASLGGCLCSQAPRCPAIPDAGPVSDQPYGGPCTDDTSCRAGLTCLDFLATSRWRMCSTPCSKAAPCADGRSTCLTDADGGRGLCLPPCTTDSDCKLGALAGRCGNGACLFVQCAEASHCAAGSYCAGIFCVEDENGFSLGGGYCRVSGT